MEHAVRTIKDIMKRCYSGSVSWRLALIKFLSTPDPDGWSAAELCGHQFKGIMPVLNPKVNETEADLLSERKEKEKIRFDAKSKQLPVFFIGSNVACLNADLKSWSVGTIHARSHHGRSYQILTENGLIISRNHIHLRPTRVKPVPVDGLAKSCIFSVKANKPIVTSSGDSTPSNAIKAPISHSTKSALKTNNVPF